MEKIMYQRKINMIVSAVPRWEKNEEEFREDGRATIRFELGVDYREIDCDDDWPQCLYQCFYDREDEIWITEIKYDENDEDARCRYSACSLDTVVDMIQDDLMDNRAVYDIFYCYIREDK
jgi:hypothetical protein